MPLIEAPSGEKCRWCGKAASRQCDCPIGFIRQIGHPPKAEMERAKQAATAFYHVEMQHTITCDKPICRMCAVQLSGGIDFCPDCLKRIKTAAARQGRR